MRIACLQFAPELGEIDHNIEQADAILERADPQDIDLLVLPELAFSGYNFKSLRHISPHLELGEIGISAAWSRQAALKYDCVVVTGYPEKVDPVESWPADPEYYNSAIIIDGDGDVVGNYRKSHLYYTDETWALEGGSGFYAGRVHGLGHMAVGICMDINPYKFEAPWESYEFSSHVLETGARLVVLSMAWCTHVDQEEFFLKPAEPDMDTLLYWITRMQPIISIDSNQETIIVFGNRCGAEGDTTYVGTSTVLGIKSGEISLYGILGRDEESLLVVDTDAVPYATLKLQSREPVPVDEHGKDSLAPQAQYPGDSSDLQWNRGGQAVPTTHDMGVNQAPPSDIQEQALDSILVTRGPERDPQCNDHWLEPSRRPREHPTSGPFRVNGSSVGITPSSSHVSCAQFTQSHIAAPVAQQCGISEMRPTMSEGDYDNNLPDDFSESEEESLLSDSFSESEEEGWHTQEPRICADGRRHAASTQREYMTQDAGGRYPSTLRSQAGLPNPQLEQHGALEHSLVHMVSDIAVDHEALPSSNAENFKEEDIYKYVHGKNLTSEHHIRYHTHLLRERLARRGLPAEDDDGREDQETYQEEEEDLVFETYLGSDAPHQDHRCVADKVPNKIEQTSSGLEGLNTQPEYTHENATEARQTFWQDHSAEPTPIADTPMSYMTLFSQTRTRRRHERQAPAFPIKAAGQTGHQSQARHAEDPDSGPKTGPASIDGDEHAAYRNWVPALSRSRTKENPIPLQDPSRRPKAATRQVPPLRLVPREAPTEKEREREVRERSRRTPRQVLGVRDMERQTARDKGRDKGRKTPVPMVLVYEGDGEG